MLGLITSVTLFRIAKHLVKAGYTDTWTLDKPLSFLSATPTLLHGRQSYKCFSLNIFQCDCFTTRADEQTHGNVAYTGHTTCNHVHNIAN